jgi:RNA polymerase sigma factor (sigma-70 family)
VSRTEPDPRPSTAGDYRRIVAALASRAARMGARDPESTAHEAIRRSLANQLSRAAVDYYFRDPLPPGTIPPDWTLAQLMGWLHGVLRFVVREEHARVRSQRETPVAIDDLLDVPDGAPSQLEALVEAELRTIVRECVMQLRDERREALLLRLQGAKYDEIARRLGTNENTVATWLRRSSRELVQQVQARLTGRTRAERPAPVASVSHA